MKIMVGLLFLASVAMHGCLVRSDTHRDNESKPHVTIGEHIKVPFSKCDKFIQSKAFHNNECITLTLGKVDEKNKDASNENYAKTIDFMEQAGISCEEAPSKKRPADAKGIGFRLTLPKNNEQHQDYKHIDVWCQEYVATVGINIFQKYTYRSNLHIHITNKHKNVRRFIVKHLFKVSDDGVVRTHMVNNLGKDNKLIKSETLLDNTSPQKKKANK